MESLVTGNRDSLEKNFGLMVFAKMLILIKKHLKGMVYTLVKDQCAQWENSVFTRVSPRSVS